MVKKRYLTFTIKDNDEKSGSELEKNENTEPKDLTTLEITKPETPVAKLLDKNGNELDSESSKIKYDEGEKITINGSTIAKGEVKLYIFSEPQQATVMADDDGAWSYTIENIEPGEHRVEAEVTDPATGTKSERAQVLAFEVAQNEQAQVVSNNIEEPVTFQAEDSSTGLLIAVGTSLALLIMGIIGLIIYKRKHPHHDSEFSNETINPSDGMGSNL